MGGDDGIGVPGTRPQPPFPMRPQPLGSPSHTIGTIMVVRRERVALRTSWRHNQFGWRSPYGESQLNSRGAQERSAFAVAGRPPPYRPYQRSRPRSRFERITLAVWIAAFLAVAIILPRLSDEQARDAVAPRQLGFALYRPSYGPIDATDEKSASLANIRFEDQWGHPHGLGDFAGEHLLIYLGCTTCADADRILLQDLSVIMDGLGGDAALLHPIFIARDAERDSPERLWDYLANAHYRLLALRGSDGATAREFEAALTGSPEPGASETRGFSMLFLGPDGRLLEAIDPSGEPGETVRRIHDHLRRGGGVQVP